jgi:branched-chain amino acid transport system ATP-binding protein
MAKMINRALLKYHISKLTTLNHQLSFLEAYLEIILNAKQTKKDKTLMEMKKRHSEILEPLMMKAGIHSDNVETKKQDLIDQINKKYHWHFKALSQSKKRAMKKQASSDKINHFADKEAKMHQKQEEALQSLALRYTKDENNIAMHQSNYEINKTKLEQKYLTKQTKLDQKFALDTIKIKKNYSDRIERIKKAIEDERPLLKKYAKGLESATEIPQDVILRLENLNMRFGGLLAVDNLSFDVKKGEIFGLIGPNGAGKTTIFNCITRFYRPTSGLMLFRKNPVEVIHLNDYPVHNIIKQGIVRTFQNVELIWELSILDNLLVAAHTTYRSGFFGQLLHMPKLKREEEVMRSKALGILETMGLLQYQYMIPYGLPYGILKKVELARTLMANPKLIILDEPAAGLNDLETENLAHIIKKIRDDYQATIFLVEHDMGLVMDICDTVCAISFGKMLAIGTPTEIQNNPLVRSAYLGEES